MGNNIFAGAIGDGPPGQGKLMWTWHKPWKGPATHPGSKAPALSHNALSRCQPAGMLSMSGRPWPDRAMEWATARVLLVVMA